MGYSNYTNDSTWERTTRKYPCPICQEYGYCEVSSDGKTVHCMKAQSDRPFNYRQGGWLHTHPLYYEIDIANPGSKPTAIIPAKTRRIYPQLDLKTLSNVYKRFMEHCPISPRHAAYLVKAGVPACHAAFAGTLRADRARQVSKLLIAEFGLDTCLNHPLFNYDTKELASATWSSGCLLPAIDGASYYRGVQIRFDNPTANPKYLWISNDGAAKGYSVPLAFFNPTNTDNERAKMMLITEGWKKAAVAGQHFKMPAMGLAGVRAWNIDDILAEIDRCQTEVVLVALDSDKVKNELVRQAEKKLLEEIANARPALKLLIVNWPYSEATKGIDDAILSGLRRFSFDKYYPLPDFETLPVTRLLQEQELIGGKYLPDIDIELGSAVFIKSPVGSGKTEMLSRIVANVGIGSIMVIGSRTILLSEQAARLHLRNYTEFRNSKGEMDKAALTACSRLAITLDSLVHLQAAHEIELLIIDEIEAVLAHLLSNTIRPTRKNVLNTFITIIKKAKRIICLDAHLSRISYDFIRKLRPDTKIEVIVNPHAKTEQAPIIAYARIQDLMAYTVGQAAAGDNLYIPTNSKTGKFGTLALEKSLVEKFPDLAIQRIDSDNSDQPEIRLKMRNLKAYAAGWNLLIASPTLATGVDISVKHFNQTILFAGSGSTNHRELLQHIARNRRAESIHVYIQPSHKTLETNPEKIKEAELKKMLDNAEITSFSATGERIADYLEQLYLELYSAITARDNDSRNNLAENFYQQAAQEGHAVDLSAVYGKADRTKAIQADILASQPDIDAGKALERAKKAVSKELDSQQPNAAKALADQTRHKKAIETAQLTAILEARDISASKAKLLEEKVTKTEAEKAELAKFKIVEFFGIEPSELTAEAVNRYNHGKIIMPILDFMRYFDLRDTRQEDLASFDSLQKCIPDVSHHTSHKKLRIDILGWLLPTSFEPTDFEPVEFTAEDLITNGFVKRVLAKQEDIKQLLGITVKKDFEAKPVELLSTLLSQIKLGLVSQRVGNRADRRRVYSLDCQQLALTQAIVSKKLAAASQYDNVAKSA